MNKPMVDAAHTNAKELFFVLQRAQDITRLPSELLNSKPTDNVGQVIDASAVGGFLRQIEDILAEARAIALAIEENLKASLGAEK